MQKAPARATSATPTERQIPLGLWPLPKERKGIRDGRQVVRLLRDLCRRGDCAVHQTELLRRACDSGIEEPRRALGLAIQDGLIYRESIQGQVLLFPRELRDAELTVVRCARHLAEGRKEKFKLVHTENHGTTADHVIALLRSTKEATTLFAADNEGAKWWAMKIGYPVSMLRAWLTSDASTPFGNAGFRLNCTTHAAHHIALLDASRFGVESLAQFLESIPLACNVTLIGNCNEIPSTGHGQPLHDMWSSGIFSSMTIEIDGALWGAQSKPTCSRLRRGALRWRLERAGS